MNDAEFKSLFDQVTLKRDAIMNERKFDYARGENRLHNFYRAANLQGISPEKSLQGMLTKHIVSIYDMIDDIDKGMPPHALEAWLEKICDTHNYLDLLLGLLSDRYEWEW